MTLTKSRQHEAMERFQDRILIGAILIVEQNDYLGLLTEKAKMIVSRAGKSFNNESAEEILRDMQITIDECEKYRKLNSILAPKTSAVHIYDYHYFDNYFKSRIRSAKLILKKLEQFTADLMTNPL